MGTSPFVTRINTFVLISCSYFLCGFIISVEVIRVDNKLLKTVEVAKWLDLPIDRVYSLARQNMIPTIRLGRQLRFDRKALDEFIQSGGRALPGGWKREV